ncbi:MAG: hypothetical protein ACU85V_12055 [Gammaproteobacteria bacterium]
MTDTKRPNQKPDTAAGPGPRTDELVALSLAAALVVPVAAAADGAADTAYPALDEQVFVYDSSLAESGADKEDDADEEAEPEDDVGYGIYDYDSRLTG